MKKKLLIFASGEKSGGGSGFENLVRNLDHTKVEFVGVISNHENGGVRERADRLQIPFIYFPGPYTKEAYEDIVARYTPDCISLSGWIKLVRGLNPKITFNIHPGPLPQFGGKGMYSSYLHEAVLQAYRRGDVHESEVNIHFVTDEYDKGPICFKHKVSIQKDDTAETLFRRANDIELQWQPIITQTILDGEIYWDGKNPNSIVGQQKYDLNRQKI